MYSAHTNVFNIFTKKPVTVTITTHKKTKPVQLDEYSPMEGAKFASEMSKYFGPFETVAEAYDDSIKFQAIHHQQCSGQE